MLFRKIFRDPLVHLLFICTGIFALHYQAISSINNRETIVFDNQVTQRIINQFQNQWNRYPSEAERKELIDKEIMKEIYLRQGLKKEQNQPYNFTLAGKYEKPDILYKNQRGQEFNVKVFYELKKKYRVEFRISDKNLYQQLRENFPVAFK